MKNHTAKAATPPLFPLYLRGGRVGLLGLIVILLSVVIVYAEKPGKWAGVDEAVIEKYAQEHGREAKEPLINKEHGDLLLFVFLLAGTVGGFAAGYFWRTLMDQKRTNNMSKDREKKEGDATIL